MLTVTALLGWVSLGWMSLCLVSLWWMSWHHLKLLNAHCSNFFSSFLIGSNCEFYNFWQNCQKKFEIFCQYLVSLKYISFGKLIVSCNILLDKSKYILIFHAHTNSGLYYKNFTIINNASRVISKWCHKLSYHLLLSIMLL